MLIKRSSRNVEVPLSSEITPRALFESRRDFIRQMAAGSIAGSALLQGVVSSALAQTPGAQKLSAKANSTYVVMDKQSSFKDASTY